MTTQQTDALRLAEQYDHGDPATHGNAWKAAVCTELRIQHDRIADLEAQLEAICTGGASGPLIGQPQAMPDLSQLTERGAKAWAGVDAQGLREGFTAADMATASAQGFRDGVASVSAGSEPVPNNRRSLEDVFRRLSDSAYCNFIEQIGSDVCLGWKYKARHGMFGEAELKGHTLAGEMLGRHKAFAEAANALRGSDAPLTYPSPTEGMAGWISVDERLPEVGVTVLVYEPFRHGEDWPGTVRILFDYICPDYEDWHDHCASHEHFMAVGGANACGPDVTCTGPSEKAPYTHWMPLPAAPGPADGESNG